MYAKGVINSKLSSLSNNPPCPGKRFEKSFIPQYLFIADAAISPTWPIIARIIEIINICQ